MNWTDFLTDLLLFRRMITPYLIQVLFWIGVVLSVIAGLGILFGGLTSLGEQRDGVGVILGLGALCLSPLVVLPGILISRIFAELLILAFQIHDALRDIKEILERQRSAGA